MNNAIELTDVGWRAGNSFALKDLTIRVPSGSIYGFLGPNGSGKTTTIRMFMGMMKPDRSIPRYGDHGIYDIRDRVLRKGARLFDRPDLAKIADQSGATKDPTVSSPFHSNRTRTT